RAGGLFFVGQRAFFRSTAIDQNRERQRQIDVRLERENVLLLTVFKHADVFRFKVADEAFVFVGGGEEDIRQVRFSLDYLVRILRQLIAIARCRRGRRQRARNRLLIVRRERSSGESDANGDNDEEQQYERAVEMLVMHLTQKILSHFLIEARVY